MRVIQKHRNKAAIFIQKHYKRYVTQNLYHKILELERNYVCLKWVPSHSSFVSQQNVEVIGTFTSPPWCERVELELCPLRSIFVKYLRNTKEGTYLLKYIVNGEFKCDELHLPIAIDPCGYVNNILEIGYNESSEAEEDFSQQSSVDEFSSPESNEPGVLRLSKHNLKILDNMTKRNAE
jgi:hypothetical protein